ncbi:MAG: hypothetical protein JKX85_08365 [Phycisphaeraceae bacterium]|nr:hypothetical protein [Phycisphaeraceae bacterium]
MGKTSGNLYYVRLIHQGKTYYKLGFTSLSSVEERLNFGGSGDGNLIDKVIVFAFREDAFDIEQLLHVHFCHARYAPRYGDPNGPLYKNGQTELYSADILGLDPEYLPVDDTNNDRWVKLVTGLMIVVFGPILIPFRIFMDTTEARGIFSGYIHSGLQQAKEEERKAKVECLIDSLSSGVRYREPAHKRMSDVFRDTFYSRFFDRMAVRNIPEIARQVEERRKTILKEASKSDTERKQALDEQMVANLTRDLGGVQFHLKSHNSIEFRILVDLEYFVAKISEALLAGFVFKSDLMVFANNCGLSLLFDAIVKDDPEARKAIRLLIEFNYRKDIMALVGIGKLADPVMVMPVHPLLVFDEEADKAETCCESITGYFGVQTLLEIIDTPIVLPNSPVLVKTDLGCEFSVPITARRYGLNTAFEILITNTVAPYQICIRNYHQVFHEACSAHLQSCLDQERVSKTPIESEDQPVGSDSISLEDYEEFVQFMKDNDQIFT